MKVLIACEFSGIVRDAFIKRGHDAMSCDLLDTERPGPHYKGDVLDILGDGWDMMIAHPPCQYLSYAGAHVWNKPGRAEQREQALKFFLKLFNAPIPRVAVENPVGYPNTKFRKPDQIVHPYQFGEPKQKNICLWLRGLPLLVHGTIVDPIPEYIRKTGPKAGEKIHFAEACHGAHKRSVFFQSIADAMAEQWGRG